MTWCLFLLVVLFSAVGCGSDPKNNVSGKVTFEDVPVAGTIAFIGADNQETSGFINPNGTYLVKDLPLGEFKVTIKGFPGMPAGIPSKNRVSPSPRRRKTRRSRTCRWH